MESKKFRVEAFNDHTKFKVYIKSTFGFWRSGFITTNYFDVSYSSEDAALRAIEMYKNRFTYVD